MGSLREAIDEWTVRGTERGTEKGTEKGTKREIERGRMDSLDVSLKQYWKSWDGSLNGKEWQMSEEPELAVSLYDWSDVIEIILEMTLCLLLAILIVIVYYCINRQTKLNKVDEESVRSEPPTYEDVIKKDKDELENLKDLPSYLDAVRLESEMETKS